MQHRTRRQFLADVGRGALVGSLGLGLARELGLGIGRALADEPSDALSFGPLEPLVALLQETAPDRLLEVLVDRLAKGADLKTLLAAGALANARTFGGEDYVGFHTMMALGPAWTMAEELPEKRRALPVLKVLLRNTSRIQAFGGRKNEVLRAFPHLTPPPCGDGLGALLRRGVREKDLSLAEAAFENMAGGSPGDLIDGVLPTVEDDTEVHRVALAYRAWDLSKVIGAEHAHTLLRQSVRYCVKSEAGNHGKHFGKVRELLPKLLESHHLLDREPGTKPCDDAWVDATSRAIFEATPDDAAGLAAAALAEGRAPADLGEAISLAANQLLLRDTGRSVAEARPGKAIGTVHGDSVGLHASDSANAWRGLARAGAPRNTYACLILGAYQAALDRVARGGDFLTWAPNPKPEDVAKVIETDPGRLLAQADEAIRAQDQAKACAIVHRYGALDLPPRPVFDLLLGYATSEDGALHAEKYYRTVVEEFAATRPAFRWRHLDALARVTASEYGQTAAGFEEARRRLGV